MLFNSEDMTLKSSSNAPPREERVFGSPRHGLHSFGRVSRIQSRVLHSFGRYSKFPNHVPHRLDRDLESQITSLTSEDVVSDLEITSLTTELMTPDSGITSFTVKNVCFLAEVPVKASKLVRLRPIVTR